MRTVRASFRLWAGRRSTYDERDRIMAMLAPIVLIAVLLTWLIIIFAGYALMYFCVTGRSVAGSIELSGSSVFTLGTSSDAKFWPSVMTYTEAGIGLLLVALFITYFPSIYGAFTRRETGVTLLEVRAGSPPQATSMLIRFHRIEERVARLRELWQQWEAWFADIEESHAPFPVLAFFRSPQPERSWVTAAGALLDGASFWVACIQHGPDPDAQLCLRAGFLSLRRISDAFGLAYDPDPQPGDPISITRDEWDGAMAQMEQAGVPLVPDREKAWTDWRGWRVNYDVPLLRLARLTEAPLAPWTSDRSPIGEDRASGRTASGWRRWRRSSRSGRR